MSKFIIPTSYKVMGRRIKVVLDSDRLIDEGDFGSHDGGSGVVRIRPVSEKFPLDLAEQTFLHEALHSALYSMSHELYSNEEFISTIAGLLHQILTTGEGDLLNE